jgi:hypothetical protein
MPFWDADHCHYKHNLSKLTLYAFFLLTLYAFFSGASSPMRKILIVDGNADLTKDDLQFYQRRYNRAVSRGLEYFVEGVVDVSETKIRI